MVRAAIFPLFLTICLAAHAADHGRAMRLSDLPVAAQDRILETVQEDAPWMQLGQLSSAYGTTSDSFGLAVGD